MKRNYSRIGMMVLTILLLTAGCTTNSSEITQLEKSGQTEEKTEAGETLSVDELFTDGRMELPESGIVTREQMNAIAGTDATYQFYSQDEARNIAYYWSYEGRKIQNPVEQNLKVIFTDDNVENVKQAANGASVGLGVTLAKENLAAPAKLTLELSQKWDADLVILCKLVDGVPEKMCDVSMENTETDTTKLSFQVTEMGDTYYLVGGNTGARESTDAGTEEAALQEEDSSPENADTHTCTISIECSTILDNMEDLKKSKEEFVPSDGRILYASEISYTPGETVYDVRYRACREADIHMEASYTPAYSSYYVEGINQLYEFDCGSLSGWMYSVNGWFPNYGCSKYEVSDGDVIEWRYTCDLGRDVGDQYYE